MGGTSKLDGLKEMLLEKVQQRFLGEDPEANKVEIYAGRKDNPLKDPIFMSWKGGAAFGSIESGEEFIISSTEWHMHGMRIVKEKTPFLWT